MEELKEEIIKQTKKIKKFKILIGIQIIITLILLCINVIVYNESITDNNCSNYSSEIQNLSAAEIVKFNANFINYKGVKSGLDVKELIHTINSHNSKNSDDYNFQIRINNMYDKTATDEDVLKAERSGNTEVSEKYCDKFDNTNIKSHLKYMVYLNYENGDRDSIICNIDIIEKKEEKE